MVNVDIKSLYHNLASTHEWARKTLGHPLTLAEKILWSHLQDSKQGPLERGLSFVLLRPDRVAMQDATAQMAILQFMQAGKAKVTTPTTVHCDHLIIAERGAAKDTTFAQEQNKEVYDFLRSSAQKYGMGFWRPGSGIIHQVVLENYAFPGGLMIGTDSHTPNAGGLGMMAVGVGGADAVDVMVGMPWEVLYPKIIGVKLIGKLNGWTSGKDIILKLLEILTVKGGTNKIIEYFGPGVETLSATAQATVTNMGAELGATCSLFPYHNAMGLYLRATRRSTWADLADSHAALLKADPQVESTPEKYYDELIEIDLNQLEPYVVGPHSPDLARPLSRIKEDFEKNKYPTRCSAALIGSCTNSSYEDLGRAASVAQQGLKKGLKAQSDFFVSPGSDQVYDTTQRDGFLDTLDAFGAIVMSNSCGPCIGQWKRTAKVEGSNSIITSFNRNFKGRNDGNTETLAFIGSPEIVTAIALAGDLTFNPLTDTLCDNEGKAFKLEAPQADPLPKRGFAFNDGGFQEPAQDGSQIQVEVNPNSERLQLLNPFMAPPSSDTIELVLLAKIKGKCTTDHISPAGKWLKYRGHLDKISDNMLLGGLNAFSLEPGFGHNRFTGEKLTFAQLARTYKDLKKGWMIVGDENYGEGSSREHAAMSPRFLGGRVVLARSFARIHETNLKKQGLLPLHFIQNSDWDKFKEKDNIILSGLLGFAPGQNFVLSLEHEDGTKENFEVRHTFNEEQIQWYRAGSALNLIK